MSAPSLKQYIDAWKLLKHHMEKDIDLLDAAQRMQYYSAIDDFNEEVAESATWDGARWEHFLDRAQTWWEDLVR